MDGLEVPPQRIEVDHLVLRRLTVDDAAAVAGAVAASYAHLQPWMPWATPEAKTVAFQRRRLAGVHGAWEPDGDYAYGIFYSGSHAFEPNALVGGVGLHRRLGPGALEIGYWVHMAHVRKGIATTAAGALTSAGFAMAAMERIEIRCDEANHASAAVPQRLGFRLVQTIEHAVEAPAEVGRRMVWEITKDEWAARPPAVPNWLSP